MRNLILCMSTFLAVTGQTAFSQPLAQPSSSGSVIACFTSDGQIKSGFDTIDGEVIDRGYTETAAESRIFGSSVGPAQIGLSFGFFAIFSNVTEPMLLRGMVQHPPMGLGHDGKSEQHWPIDIPEAKEISVFVGYSLEDPFELLLGDWTFSIWDGTTKLLGEVVTLIDPTETQFSCE